MPWGLIPIIKQRHSDVDHAQAAKILKTRVAEMLYMANRYPGMQSKFKELYKGQGVFSNEFSHTPIQALTISVYLMKMLYNDMRNLVLMDRYFNTSKSDADIIEWLSSHSNYGQSFVKYVASAKQDESSLPSDELDKLIDKQWVLYQFKNDPLVKEDFRGKLMGEVMTAWMYQNQDICNDLLNTELQHENDMFLYYFTKNSVLVDHRLDAADREIIKLALKEAIKTERHHDRNILRNTIKKLAPYLVDSVDDNSESTANIIGELEAIIATQKNKIAMYKDQIARDADQIARNTDQIAKYEKNTKKLIQKLSDAQNAIHKYEAWFKRNRQEIPPLTSQTTESKKAP